METWDFEDDEELNDYIEAVANLIDMDECGTFVINLEAMQRMQYAYRIVEKLAGTIHGAKLSYEINTPYQSMGSISLTGKNLEFADSALFLAAVNLASNIDIYAMTDGTVAIDFTFHGLTRKIADDGGK